MVRAEILDAPNDALLLIEQARLAIDHVRARLFRPGSGFLGPARERVDLSRRDEARGRAANPAWGIGRHLMRGEYRSRRARGIGAPTIVTASIKHGLPPGGAANLASRPRDIGLEIDLRPRQVADVLMTEAIWMRQDQLAHRGFVFGARSPRSDEVIGAIGEHRCHARREAEKPYGLAMPFVGMLGRLGEIDDDAVAQADLDRLVARLDRPVEQQHILRRCIEKTRDHPRVIEHVAIHHQDHRPCGKPLMLDGQRDDAPFAVEGFSTSATRWTPIRRARSRG